MIELPDDLYPNGMAPEVLDFGSVQRGASSLRVDRPGSRWRVAFSFRPSKRARLAKFVRGKRKGLKVAIPLSVPQGVPGSPVVDGAGQAGETISLRGLTPGYVAKEDYWLTIFEADGTGYLHQVAETAFVDADGKVTLSIETPLRAPFADGDRVELAKPTVEGFVDGENWGWQVPLHHLVSVSVTIEEYQ